jgi:tetratricopeptide (TPR) repeat protein
MDYKEAVEYLENGQPDKCTDYFRQNGDLLEYAYCLILTGRYDDAAGVIYPLDSVRADWVRKLLPILKGEFKSYPTYFEIRNFLEIDLTMLIKAHQTDAVNNLLKIADIFQGVNNESYKLFGRGLLKNEFYKEAKIFLDRSLNEYYNDVELHYLFTEYYLALGHLGYAKRAAENCLKINPDYYPAKKTVKELSDVTT